MTTIKAANAIKIAVQKDKKRQIMLSFPAGMGNIRPPVCVFIEVL